MLLYRLFIHLYPLIARLLATRNRQARAWVAGRKGLLEQIARDISINTRPVIWMHCASVGEFEQGLPVFEQLRQKYPDRFYLLSFFSPSGYEARKDYKGADYVCYLPMDSPANACSFMDAVKPELILFIKYEFWYYYLQEARKRKIPLLLVSGIFRDDQPFFRWYGSMYRKMLNCFTCLLVQDEDSKDLIDTLDTHPPVMVSGDTRFDRVIAIRSTFQPIQAVERFCSDHPVLVAGSTWTEDDEELDHFANTHPQYRFLVAPHHIEEERLSECEQLYQHAIRYSRYLQMLANGEEIPASIHVLIMDNIGMLSRLYHYADVCYIGGGFGDDGIHNILEASVYDKPVVFGPVYEKYREAGELIDAGGGFSIESALELESLLGQLFTDKSFLSAAGKAAGAYTVEKSGATEKVIRYIQANLLRTN